MNPFQFTQTKTISNELTNSEFISQIKESLEKMGFIRISQENDIIHFHYNIKERNLGSFQRRYGNGKIKLDLKNKTLTLTEDYKKHFIWSVSLLVALGILILISHLTDWDIQTILMVGIPLLISSALNYLLIRTQTIKKQKRLLEMIESSFKEKK